MCNPCCLIVGYNTRSDVIDAPNGYSELPEKIICPYCSTITKAVYRRDDYIFTICFIPTCPCCSSSPYISCQNCMRHLPTIRGNPCRSCHVSRPFEAEYCPNCGTKCYGEVRNLRVN